MGGGAMGMSTPTAVLLDRLKAAPVKLCGCGDLLCDGPHPTAYPGLTYTIEPNTNPENPPMTCPEAQDMPKHRTFADIPYTAEYCNTSVRHVRSLVARRQVPYFKVGGKVRFDLADIDAWLDANRIEPAN